MRYSNTFLKTPTQPHQLSLNNSETILNLTFRINHFETQQKFLMKNFYKLVKLNFFSGGFSMIFVQLLIIEIIVRSPTIHYSDYLYSYALHLIPTFL